MKATNFYKVKFEFFEDGIEHMKKEISKGYFWIWVSLIGSYTTISDTYSWGTGREVIISALLGHEKTYIDKVLDKVLRWAILW